MTEVRGLLEAREFRYRYQKALLEAYKCPVVVFSMNIPGADKCSKSIEALHEYGAEAFRKRMERAGVSVIFCQRHTDFAGPVTFLSVEGQAEVIKLKAIEVEESDEWGRLYDIDVIGENGQPVSRADLDLPPRQCFLCSQPANVCRRSGRHEPTEVMVYVQERIKAFTQTYTIQGDLRRK